jgi:hypothetical protein
VWCHSIFVVTGSKTLRNSQKNVSTTSKKLHYAKEGVPGRWKDSKVAEKASLMKTVQAVRSLHERRTILNEWVNALVQEDRRINWYESEPKSFLTESITKYTLTTINTRWDATQRDMAAKLTRLTHKLAIQLHLVAESCTICNSRSRRPVRKLLDTPSYCCGSAYSIIHEDLGYHRSYARRVTKQLTDKHKRQHVAGCMQFLQR